VLLGAVGGGDEVEDEVVAVAHLMQGEGELCEHLAEQLVAAVGLDVHLRAARSADRRRFGFAPANTCAPKPQRSRTERRPAAAQR